MSLTHLRTLKKTLCCVPSIYLFIRSNQSLKKEKEKKKQKRELL